MTEMSTGSEETAETTGVSHLGVIDSGAGLRA